MRNVGIVGLGHVAPHQISALGESSKFRLVAACDTDATRFRQLDDAVRRFTDIDEMLVLPGLDVVIVASPNRLHVEHGIRVMAARKWLVIEKPLAETRNEFEQFRARRAELAGRCTLALHAAHGVEVDWFCNSVGGTVPRFQRLVSFESRFYDPYVDDGHLSSSALSLGGSWIDSGINALSVICRLIEPECLQITDSRMTRRADMPCRELQGTVDFRIDQRDGDGAGSIDTDWTLGRDSKATAVRFAGDDGQYLLDHSAQRVLRMHGERAEALFACRNGRPRLTNHYIGVLADLDRQLDAGVDNFDYCDKLHRFLYQAEEWCH